MVARAARHASAAPRPRRRAAWAAIVAVAALYVAPNLAGVALLTWRTRGADIDRLMSRAAETLGPDNRVCGQMIFYMAGDRLAYGPYVLDARWEHSVDDFCRKEFGYVIRMAWSMNSSHGVAVPLKHMPDFTPRAVLDRIAKEYGTKIDSWRDPDFGPVEICRLDWSRPRRPCIRGAGGVDWRLTAACGGRHRIKERAMIKLAKPKIGFIPANRGFFSDKLASKMRGDTIKVLRAAGADVVVPSTKDTKVGCVETVDEAMLVGRMFREQQVEGIVVNCVNFGDEKGVAITVKESGLNVPILVVGAQEEEVLTPTTERRDSFCGLLSTCEGLRQLGRAYSVAETPICYPTDDSFRATAERFIAVVRVVAGLRNARYGQIGARPNDFWTCRYNEKALQQLGPTVVTLDLSEVFGAVWRRKTDAAVRRVIADMKRTIDCSAVADDILEKIAKFELALKAFAAEQKLDALAIQCWTSIQENLGICSCTTMSRFDDRGLPCACEADIMGALSMHALQLASGGPSCLADWNNVHNDDPELVNCWHCGVFPTSWAKGKPKMGCQEIIAGTTGRDHAMGVVEFVMQDGPVTLCRATQDNAGAFKVALAQGAVEPNKAKTFGSYGWVRIPGIQRLYRLVMLRHFPHHVAMNRSTVGNVLWEAFGNYLGFQVFTAERSEGCWTPELPFKA